MVKLPKEWQATIVLGCIGSLLAGGIAWGLGKLSLLYLLLLAVMMSVASAGVFWGRRIGQDESKLLIETVRQDKETLQKQYDERIRNLHQEILDLRKRAVSVSIYQPRGISFFPTSGRVVMHLYINSPIPLEAKDAQAIFFAEGRKITLTNDGVCKVPIATIPNSVSGSACVPLEKYLDPKDTKEREILQTLAQKHSEVEITIFPNLRGGSDIGDIERTRALKTLVDVTS